VIRIGDGSLFKAKRKQTMDSLSGSSRGVNRSAKRRRCLVPVALRAPAPGYAERYIYC
jgi:hypothetical protein